MLFIAEILAILLDNLVHDLVGRHLSHKRVIGMIDILLGLDRPPVLLPQHGAEILLELVWRRILRDDMQQDNACLVLQGQGNGRFQSIQAVPGEIRGKQNTLYWGGHTHTSLSFFHPMTRHIGQLLGLHPHRAAQLALAAVLDAEPGAEFLPTAPLLERLD